MTAPEREAWSVVNFETVPSVPCPCGTAQRAFADDPHSPASVHVTRITTDAQVHYHQRQTETYYVLECGPDAAMELDGERIPIRPGTAIRIPPLVRHRAVGEMTIINIVVPPFDPADEFFD